MKARLAAISAALTLLALTTAGSCGQGPADKYTRNCAARDGHVVTTHRGSSTSRVCVPNQGVKP